MSTNLNQIIAIKKGVVSATQSELTKIYHTIQKREPLSGISKTYRSKFGDEGDQLPSEKKNVQVRIPDVLDGVARVLTRLFDVTAASDWGNCHAKADIVVDGNVLVKNAPATYLIFLEKQLVDLRTVIDKLPTLDPAEDWHGDANTGLYVTDPIETVRSKKVPRSRILYEATDKHPAQVESYFEDILEGYWKTIKFSGEIPAVRRNELAGRVEKLTTAVKYAREKANSVEVEDILVGDDIFNYLFK